MHSPLITVPHLAYKDPVGPLHIFEQKPKLFLAAMDQLYPELLAGSDRREKMNTHFCAFLSSGEFVGSFIERSTEYGRCIASPRKNPWLKDKGDWMFRAFLAATDYLGSKVYVGWCRKEYNYGMMRFFYRLGLGGKSAFQDRSVITTEATPETRVALLKFIEESKHNYVAVRNNATERLKLITQDVLPIFEPYSSPLWSGDVTL